MYTGWKIIGIIYAIALIPSLFVMVVFIRNNILPQLNKPSTNKLLTFISIWLVMPFYLLTKLVQKLGGK